MIPSRTTCSFLIGAVLLLGVSTEQVYPQSLQDSLREAREEVESLKRIREALDEANPEYTQFFKIWAVFDEGLRLRIFNVFREANYEFSTQDTIFVILRNDSTIAEIRIGRVTTGPHSIRTHLDSRLIRDIVSRNYELEDLEPDGYKRRQQRPPQPRPVAPKWAAASFSLFEVGVRFGNDWGVIGRVGDDMLGYPFWTSGQAWVLASYKALKLGARLPVHGGKEDCTPQVLRRLINGSTGVAGEIEIEWEELKVGEFQSYAGIGGSFSIGELGKRRPEYLVGVRKTEIMGPDTVSYTDSLFSITSLGHFYYALDWLFDSDAQLLAFKLGAGAQRVVRGRYYDSSLDIEILEKYKPDFFPYLSVEYRNQRVEWFALSAQYSRLLMVGAWAEYLPYFMFFDIKYSRVLRKDLRPWEKRDYFAATVGFKFSF
ncbi:MAG: hypothetical protein KF749_09455 [Bacteroidetes bacterium]|nr:hypothetical protein [Bacteroidota bacterium]MCW5894851.1 hypothetical protein [Bacteroidota bacterium]